MNAAIALKLLDLIMLGFSAYQRYEDSQADNSRVADDINRMRAQYLAGEISDEEFAAEIDRLHGSVIQRRREAFAALPKPTHTP